MIMEATLYDKETPMMDWLSTSMSQAAPLLDEVIVEEVVKEEDNLKRKQGMLEIKQSNKIRRLSSLTRASSNKKGK